MCVRPVPRLEPVADPFKGIFKRSRAGVVILFASRVETKNIESYRSNYLTSTKLEAAGLVLGPLPLSRKFCEDVLKNKAKLMCTQKTDYACEFFVVRLEALSWAVVAHTVNQHSGSRGR